MVNFDVERTRERDLERHFEEYGRLKRVQIKRNYAFVQFENVDQATEAVKNTHLKEFEGLQELESCAFMLCSGAHCFYIEC